MKKMTKKRKSGGRGKGQSGRGPSVQCAKCNRTVPRDKAKKFTKNVSLVEYQVARDIRKQGGYVSTKVVTSYYCISCAVHTGKVRIRSKDERKGSEQQW
jgi:small subunit ribosomal protein S26e